MTGRQLAWAGAWLLRAGTLSLLTMTWVNWSRALALGLRAAHLLWLAPAALLLGWLKARLVMLPRMSANARRLFSSRERLFPWQLYPPQLFAFILAMIALMAWLRHHYRLDMTVNAALGAVDLAVAAALFASAGVYARVQRERSP
jgi:hypothetical protein